MDAQVTLAPHAATPAPAVRTIAVRVRREGARLAVGFLLDGDIAALRVPPAGRTRPGRALWRHTCFEVFVAADRADGYHELNLSPSAEWQAHTFRGYRDGGPLDDSGPAPSLAVRRTPTSLELDAVLALEHLSPAYADARLRLGLSAVVEDASGTISYWALRHPSDRPDFHHADAFVLALEPSPARW